jgi:Niemann-Pick C1 protein
VKTDDQRNQTCVWYGICQRDNLKTKNCLDRKPPRRLNALGIEDLKVWCSHLLPEKFKDGDDVFTCCDNAQLKEFVHNFKVAGNMFSRCPSCTDNLVRHICDFTCSPKHSEYIKVKNVKQNDDGRKLILSL